MSTNLPLDQAYLLAIWLETLIYGMFVPMFVSSVIILYRRSCMDKINRPMFVAALCMFALATAHVGIDCHRMLVGYVFERDSSGGPVAYFADPSRGTHIAADTIYVAQTLLGDAFNIYRSWLVWNKAHIVVVFPSLLFLGSLVTGFGVIYVSADHTIYLFSHILKSWVTAFYALGLAQNLLTTCLIAYRIYSQDRRSGRYRSDKTFSLIPIIVILLESASLYVLAQLVLLILYPLGQNAQYIVVESITPLVGLVFCTIIVRVGIRQYPIEISS